MLDYIINNISTINDYFINTCELVLISISISILLWVPLGVVGSKNDRIINKLLEVANIIFCIPSLALFTLMMTIPMLGIGRKSAVVALVMYSMMPLLKSVNAGITNVDPFVIESARGMGMSDFQILYHVELPLAKKVIFTGIRVTLVIMTGMSSISTYIGEKNLGRLISHGLSRQNMEMIVTGAVLISIISILLDIGMSYLEKYL